MAERRADEPRISVAATRATSRRRLIACLDADGLDASADDDLDRVDVLVLEAPAGAETSHRLRALVQRHPALRVVCVVPEPAWKEVRGLLRDGASAVVAAEEVETTLAPAVRSAHAGQLTLPSRLRSDLAQPILSVREKQMLAMVVMGFSNSEISRKLFVAESTVKSHLSSAFAKLGVRSRNEASALILDPQRGLGTGILEIAGEHDIVATVGEEAAAPAA